METPLRIVRRVLPAPGPLRPLAAAHLINDAGSALLITTLVLYFTREVGLSGPQVGLGLTVGGALGLVVGVPLGHLADLRGARELAIVLILLQAVATVSYVFVGSFAAFVVAACAVVALGRGAAAVEQGLIVRSLPDGLRVQGRAYLNAVTNIGFGVGSGIATIGIAIDTRAAYQALIVADALSYVLAAALIARVPHLPGTPHDRDSGPRLVVLRDRPYLAAIALSAVLSLQVALLDVGFPLWVSEHTAAPTAVIGVVFVMNCALVALFAVRFARGVDTPADAARSGRRSGWFAALACGLIAMTAGFGATAAVVVLLTAMVIQAVSEMQHSACHWGLSFGLAPPDRQGQYQGAAATGFASALMIGPLMITGVVALGAAGWLLFGALMAVAGAAMIPVTRWVQGTRPVATTVPEPRPA